MKKRLMASVLIVISLLLCLGGCSNKPKNDAKKDEAIRNYCSTIGEDAIEYFSELSESTCGIVPERVYFTLGEFTPDDILQAEPKPWKEMIETGTPALIVGLCKKPEIRTSEDSYSEEEIHDVLSEAVARNLVVNIYFDSDRLTYMIAEDGTITVEEVKAADGGAYRDQWEYEL